MIDEVAEDAFGRLLARLRCPSCGAGSLRLDGDSIACPACATRAEVRSRRPLAVSWTPPEEASSVATFLPPRGASGLRGRLWRWHGQSEGRLVQDVLVLPDSRLDEIRSVFAAQAAGAAGVLDVGGGKGRWRALLGQPVDYTVVDVLDPAGLPIQPGVTYVRADSEALPFSDGSFGTVLAMEVLEHLAEPARALSEMARMLAPGGLLVASTRQAWRTHSAPHDYFRYTRYGLEHLLGQAGFQPEQLLPLGGPASLIAITIDNNVPALTKPVVRQLVGHPLWRLAARLDRRTFRGNLHGPNPEAVGWLVFARRPEAA
jgi:SAM-dependent methyltransferase